LFYGCELYLSALPADMNTLHVGFHNSIELPKGGCLSISDDVPDVPRARVFDPSKHSFNPLKGIDHKKAREIAEVLYTIAPPGESARVFHSREAAHCGRQFLG
jgi:hypothetical protein